MNPVAFSLFGIQVRWYGILISIGLILGLLLALRECRRVGYDENKLLDIIIITVPISVVGARLYYVIFNWDYYKNNPSEIIAIWHGGIAIHGAILAGLITVILYTKIKNISFWQTSDIVSPSLILGQAIGRWGNFINQEAYGYETNLPWGIYIDGVKRHPTFLYESLWDLGVFAFLMWYRKRKGLDGDVFLFYLILYSIGRFIVEGFRTDSLMLGPFRVAQIVSIIFIITGITLMYYRRKKFGISK